MNFIEEVYERKKKAQTKADWVKNFDWLADMAFEYRDVTGYLEQATVETCGEAVLEETKQRAQELLIDAAAEDAKEKTPNLSQPEISPEEAERIADDILASIFPSN